ncbi:uncharacterized protein [Euwallacea fornicatus]|uniref:uncharacterized protein n=1 Tax=Euwallacea fornicatus TaxID=995702 RepID=UPI00338D51D8
MFALCMSRGPPPSPPQDSKNHRSNKHETTMSKQVKGGYLLRYRRGFFCTGWCEEWVVLYEDSTLAWYTDKTLCRLRGYVRISDAPELLAVAEWTRKVPRKPKFPRACHVGQLLAVGCTKKPDVYWLMGQTSAEINDWMTAISNTLPPPPNLHLEETRLAIGPKTMMNGHAKQISNGCATIIPNENCSSPPKDTTDAVFGSHRSSNSMDGRRNMCGKKRDPYGNDHTVVAGVALLDWGHGWGWTGQTAMQTIAPQISFTAEAFNYCHAVEDYSMAGCDDVDWSAFGDFCF